jgi:transposase-like protein
MTTSAVPSYAGYRFPAEVISHAVWLYFRFPLSLRMVDELVLSEFTPSTTADVKGSCGGHAVRRTSSAMPALRRRRLRRREAGTCWL